MMPATEGGPGRPRPGQVARSGQLRFGLAFGLGLAILLGSALGLPSPAGPPLVIGAEAGASFGLPTAESRFGEAVVFRQPLTLTATPRRVEILLSTSDGLGPVVTEVATPRPGAATLTHQLAVADGHLLPNTPLTARWRVTDQDGTTALGPSVEIVYRDDRFAWRTESGNLIRVHWYEGDAAFGRRALEIGERAVAETEALLGVTEDDPIDFFVYADQDAFYDALGPGTRENVGGQANAGIRTLFALIGPDQIQAAWVGIVIPHELVHLVFDTAVANPYHYPPRWLNEGLAVYLAEGYDANHRRAVDTAARGGDLIPLDGLTGQFPTSLERFSLAYSESVSAVDYLVAEYGPEALVVLIRSYAGGVTDDEAFQAAIGRTVSAFDAEWRESVGAGVPARHGPRPAPAGPLPADWTTDGPGPGTSAPPAAPGEPGDGDPVVGGSDAILPIVLVLVGVAAIGGLLLVLRRAGARA